MRISRKEINIVAELLKLLSYGRPKERKTFWFSGNSIQSEFSLPYGWQIENVFLDGAIKREGENEDYVKISEQTVVFNVVPSGVDIAIMAESTV